MFNDYTAEVGVSKFCKRDIEREIKLKQSQVNATEDLIISLERYWKVFGVPHWTKDTTPIFAMYGILKHDEPDLKQKLDNLVKEQEKEG